MKLAIITDQHFGARKGADYIHKYFKKFYDNIFFPYLEKNKIDTIVDMGDTFDNRRNIDLATLEWTKKNYYDRFYSKETSQERKLSFCRKRKLYKKYRGVS